MQGESVPVGPAADDPRCWKIVDLIVMSGRVRADSTLERLDWVLYPRGV